MGVGGPEGVENNNDDAINSRISPAFILGGVCWRSGIAWRWRGFVDVIIATAEG